MFSAGVCLVRAISALLIKRGERRETCCPLNHEDLFLCRIEAHTTCDEEGRPYLDSIRICATKRDGSLSEMQTECEKD